MPKHTGSCHCGQVKLATDLDPMLTMQCNCTSCRRHSGSFTLHTFYAESEIEIEGPTKTYEYTGGSGHKMTASHCTNCMTKIAVRPEIFEGMLGVPVGMFDNAKSFTPKMEMWNSERLPFLASSECMEDRFDDSAVAERLSALIEALENR
jgi:hypothetical protein